jgi:hypothetical protein
MTKLLMIVAGVLSAGCTSVSPSNDCTELHKDFILTKDQKDNAVSNWEYAVLSNNVYEPDSAHKIQLDSDVWELICQNEKPKNADHLPDCMVSNPYSFSGLHVKTYLKWAKARHIGEPKLVFVFRGTQSFFDWLCGNIFYCQYDDANKYVSDQIDYVKKLYPQYQKVPIVATGHSLGGGLVQHVAFCYDGASAVGFDTSPRIHKQDCPSGLIEPDKEKIVLLHENGEILSYIRFNNPYKDTSYDFVTWDFDDLLKLHDMHSLAMGLIKIAKQPGTPPQSPSPETTFRHTCNL